MATHVGRADPQHIFAAVAEAALDAVVVADASGTIAYANRAAHGMFRHDDLVGQRLEALMPKRMRSAHRTGFERYQRTQQPRLIGQVTQVPALRSDGHEFPMELSLAVTGDHFIGIMRDVTERVRAEQELLQKQAALEEAAELARLGHWSWDGVSQELDWSDQMKRLMGWPPEAEPRLDEFFERLRPEDARRVQAMTADAIQRRVPFSYTADMQRADGEWRTLRVVGQVHATTQGIRLTGTAQDVTEELQHEAAQREARLRLQRIGELEAESDTRSEVLRTAGHELKTPLTPMQIQLQMLASGRLGPLTQQQQNAVEVLERNARRLGRLVQDVLDLGRLEAGRLQIEPAEMDAGEVMHEVVQTFQPAAHEKEVRFETEGAGTRVRADRDRLFQVLSNLISNAVKYSRPGGTVRLSASSRDGGTLFEVHDEGVGLTPEQAERLFQPFTQVHKEGQQDGTGLGLYLVRGIVTQHGGQVNARSAGPGQGATFEVWLPGPVAATPLA